ncbi:Spindle pole body component [Apiospora rasikravindrae]|uniref:Spindle pole body component n=1 Tax=Apiospora rasikravindrae TaxID=990691 RepID=A0ABR1TXH3_9PEZI
MSSRVSNYADRRSNGNSIDNANATSSRPRMASGNHSFRAEHRESRSGPSSQPGGSFTSTAHKRSASGNPRPASRSADERRTERATITTREKLVSRAKSPERRSRDYGPSERWKTKEPSRHRATESKREIPLEDPPKIWEPVASLSKPSTAPLARRITVPPLASDMPMALQPQALHQLSLEAQEAAIIEDLLFVFMGYEGQYIRFSYAYNPSEERDQLTGPTYKISPGLDPSLEDLTQSMLKMATHYTALGHFVDVQSREEFGAVNHALCAAIRKYLHEYLIMVAQLETQFLTNDSFTLHVLNIHTLPTSQIMAQLYFLANEFLKKNGMLDDESEEESDPEDIDQILENLKKGGRYHSWECDWAESDPAARSLLTSLLRDASRPYMAMLNEWLHHGGINDPHGEFLIKEQKSITREELDKDYTDDYWERRYTLQREQDIPLQLVGVRDKVLLAGKYLNVVRECGGVDISKVAQDVPVTFDDSRFLENVNNAYAYANESLMKLLLTTHALPARLRSLKHYFFLDPSDYFTYFLELGSSELRKPVKSVNTVKLQSLLDIVLRQPGTIVSLDPFKEDVHVDMNEISLIKMLQRVVNITGMEQGEVLQPSSAASLEAEKNANGFTSLELNYSVPFPVSLVISRKTIWRYQALFRYLLSLRHLESQLCTTWQTHNNAIVWCHRSSARRIEIWKRRVWTLRARMIVFVQQLLLKMKDGSLEGTGKPDRTVDELMQDHVDFLDTCLKGCMLTNSRLIRIHSKLMQTCTLFAAYSNWLSRELEKADPDLVGNIKPPNMSDEQWRRFQALKPQKSHNDSMASNKSMLDEEARVNNLFEILKKYETNFSRHLQILLDALNHYAATETVVLLSLCARLATANQGTEYSGLRHDEDIAG